MWKWIGGGCLLIIVLLCILAYGGYRTMASIAAKGPEVTVTIAGTPQRVFAAMAHTDSMKVWHDATWNLRASRPGMVAAGDTLTSSGDPVKGRMLLIIDTVIPNQLVVTRGVAISGERDFVTMRRRDSLFAVGDSTRIVSSTSTMMADSAGKYASQGGVSGGVAGMAATMGTAGMRLGTEQELNLLKRHIEGPPAGTRKP
jgi:hypothetical protein